jgi:TRAP-type C4-dicarboxylate transport system, periplasmic component
MLRKLTTVLCLALGLTLTLALPAEAKKVWKLGHTLPQGTPEDESVRVFTKRVEELTNGEIKINVFPAMQLGDWTVMQQRVALGALEMATQPPSSQADKRISFLYFPYMFKNVDMVKKNLVAGSAFRTKLDQLFIKQGIYPVTYIPLFFGGIGSKTLPRDWNVPGATKGVKLRVPNDPSFAMHAEEMGYLATPIPMSDTFPALQTGIVDGVLGFGALGNYANYRDLVKYYIPMNDFVQLWPVMINLKLWNGLSDAEKAAITKASVEFEEQRYRDFMALDQEYRGKLKEAGVEIVDVDQAVIDAFAKAAREKCWPALADKIDKTWISETLSLIEE